MTEPEQGKRATIPRLGQTDGDAMAGLYRFRWLLILLFLVATLGLSWWRAPLPDGTNYLRDSAVMSEALRDGRWFGNEDVGEHGFLFKFLSALLFLAFGRSVELATMTTIILSTISFWLCIKLFEKLFGPGLWTLAGAVLVMGNYYVFRHSRTFMLEIPVLFAVLLLLYCLVTDRNRWVVGLVLLLVLDAKEYAFCMFSPPLLVWLIAREWQREDLDTKWDAVRHIFTVSVAWWMPSFTYLVLMFGTGLVPVNMYMAQVLRLVSRAGTATGASLGPSYFDYDVPEHLAGSSFSSNILEKWGYPGKLLHRRTFSLIAVPRFVIVPALVQAGLMLKRFFTERRTWEGLFALIVLFYIFIYILMQSIGRFLVPVLPVLIPCFILFLRDAWKNKKLAIGATVVSVVYVAGGMFFEEVMIKAKLLLYALLLPSFALVVTARVRRWTHSDLAAAGHCVLIAGVIVASVLASSLLQPDQIGYAIRYGRNWECRRIVSEFDPEERILLNSLRWSDLPHFYRADPRSTAEHKWSLASWVPKKHMLRRRNPKTLTVNPDDPQKIHETVMEHNIDRVGIVRLEREVQKDQDVEEAIRWLKEHPDYTLERTVPFEGKTLFVFDISN